MDETIPECGATPRGPRSEAGARRLRRLEVFLDVVYALVFFRMINYLPASENMRWAGSRWGLLQLLVDNREELLRIVVGIGLTLIYWNLNNKLFARLARTDGKHAVMALVQLVFVCLFVYFAISDPSLQGGPSAPALQSASLGVAGLLGLIGWRYAVRHGLTTESVTSEEAAQVSRSGLLEPATALLTLPLAWVGPLVWTLGWIVLPLALLTTLQRLRPPLPRKAGPGVPSIRRWLRRASQSARLKRPNTP